MLILRYLHVIEDIRFTVCFWLCLSVFEICVCLLEMASVKSANEIALEAKVAEHENYIARLISIARGRSILLAEANTKAKTETDELKARLAECEAGNQEYASQNQEYASQNECLRSDLSTAVNHISTLEIALSKLGQAPNEEITRFCCEITYNIHGGDGGDDYSDDGQPSCAPGEVFD